MPLRGDQRALLQLLCERGQSYEDISGLLGVSAPDVREQAREALTDLGGADPDAEVGLTDYLLGQADPIGRADAARYLQTDAAALALAQRIEEELREIAPEATLPKLPEPRGKRARAAVPGAGEPLSPPASKRGGAPGAVSSNGGNGAPGDSRQARLIAGLVAAGVILLVAILAVAGVFSGDDEEPSAPPVATAPMPPDGSTTPAPEDPARNITTVQLAPVGGSGVGGSASFGLVGGQQLYVDLDVQGLDPAPPRDAATLVWLMVGNSAGYPINNPVDSPIAPDENGNFSGRIAVPSAVALTVGSNATAVRLSSSPIREIADAAKTAAEQEAPILGFIGTELASGDIPLAEAPAPGAEPQVPGG